MDNGNEDTEFTPEEEKELADLLSEMLGMEKGALITGEEALSKKEQIEGSRFHKLCNELIDENQAKYKTPADWALSDYDLDEDSGVAVTFPELQDIGDAYLWGVVVGVTLERHFKKDES